MFLRVIESKGAPLVGTDDGAITRFSPGQSPGLSFLWRILQVDSAQPVPIVIVQEGLIGAHSVRSPKEHDQGTEGGYLRTKFY